MSLCATLSPWEMVAIKELINRNKTSILWQSWAPLDCQLKETNDHDVTMLTLVFWGDLILSGLCSHPLLSGGNQLNDSHFSK